MLGVAFTGEKRREYARECGECSGFIRNGALNESGYTLASLGGHKACQTLKNLVVGGELRVGSVAAESVHRDVDQARMDGLEGWVAEPQFVHDAGTKIFDQYIDLGKEFQDELAPLLRLEVHHNASLVSVELGEKTRKSGFAKGRTAIASGIPCRRFELDDIRAHITQGLGAQGAGNHCRQVKNAQPVARPGGSCLRFRFGFFLGLHPVSLFGLRCWTSVSSRKESSRLRVRVLSPSSMVVVARPVNTEMA